MPLLSLSSGKVTTVDTAFTHVYSSFAGRVTQTLPLANTIKIQLIDQSTFVTCTRKHLYYVRDLEPHEIAVDQDFDITSLAAPKDYTCCFVSLTNNSIVVVSLASMSLLSRYGPFEFNIQFLSFFNADMLAGYGLNMGFAFSWKNERLELQSSVTLPGAQKVVVCSSFLVFMEETSWRVTDYRPTELFAQQCEGTPELATISNSESYFAVLMRTSSAGIIQVFQVDSSIQPVACIQLGEHYMRGLMMLKFVPESIDLIAGYCNGAFSVLNETRLVKKVKIAQHNTVASYMTIDPNGTLLYVAGKERIYLAPFPKRRRITIKLEEPLFNLRNASEEEVLFLTQKPRSCTVTRFHLAEETWTTQQLPSHLEVMSLEYCKSQSKYCILATKERDLSLYSADIDLVQLKCIQSSVNIDDPERAILLLTSDDSFLVFYDGVYLRVFTTNNFQECQVYEPQVELRQLHYLADRCSLAFTSTAGFVELWNISTEEQTEIRLNTTRRITSMGSAPTTKYLFVGTSDGKISMCNLVSLRCTLSLKGDNSQVNDLEVAGNYLYALYESCAFVCWELDTKDVSYKSVLEMNRLLWSANKKWIVHYNPYNLHVNKNLFQSSNVHFVGVQEDLRFMKYIKKLYPRERTPAYTSEYESAIVFPYFFRPMHFYAYFGHISHLRQSLLNSYALTNDVFGENPLSISAQRRFTECIEVIIKHIVKTYDLAVNPYLLRSINNHTLELINLVQIRNLEKLYNLFSRESAHPRLPKLISEDITTPIYILSNDLVPTASDFQLGDLKLDTGKEVKFYESLLNLKLKIGTQESKDLLLSLMKTPNTQVLRTQYVSMLLEYKWSVLGWIMKVQAFVYALYTVWLIAHCISLKEQEDDDETRYSSTFLILAFIFNLLLLIFEVLQVLQGFRTYIKDVVNRLDLFRWLLFLLYAIVYWSSATEEVVVTFRFAVVSVSFLKGLTYFRVFALTRYLINLLKVVVLDSRAFIVILFYTTLCSGLLLHFVSGEDTSAFSELGVAFALNLGEYDSDEATVGQWVVFVVSAVINPILMLNILIAIFNDTYAKVEASKDIANNLEIANMLYEIESTFFWIRDTPPSKYIQTCTDKFTTFKTLEDRMGDLKKTIRNESAKVLAAIDECRQENQQQIADLKQWMLNRTE